MYGLDSPPKIGAASTQVANSNTVIHTAIPVNLAGVRPKYLMITFSPSSAANAGTFIMPSLGAGAVTSDEFYIGEKDVAIINVTGWTHISSRLRGGTPGILTLTPLENS